MDAFSLHEIRNEQELDDVISAMKTKAPLSLPVIVGMQAKRLHPELPQRTFVPDDVERRFSLVILTDIHPVAWPGRQSINVVWDRQRIPEDDLVNYLLKLPNWNWKEPFMLGYCAKPLADELVRIIEGDPRLSANCLKSARVPSTFATLDNDNVKEFRMPPGYKMGKIKPSHMSFMFSTWSFRDLFVEDYLKKMLSHMSSVAIFEDKGNEDTENPVCFMVHCPWGLIGLLETVEEHRRKGLGLAVITELAKELLSQNSIPAVCIVKNNTVSVKFHDKAGFKEDLSEGGWDFYLDRKTDESLVETFKNQGVSKH